MGRSDCVFLGNFPFFVTRWCAVHNQVQRDSAARGRFCTSAVKDEERVQQKSDARGLQATGRGRGAPCEDGAAAQDRSLVRT